MRRTVGYDLSRTSAGIKPFPHVMCTTAIETLNDENANSMIATRRFSIAPLI
jgi:hypothetical protein